MLKAEPRRLLVSKWSVRIAALAVTLIAVAVLFHRLFDLPTPVALNLIALSFAGAIAAILLAVYGLIRVWQRGFHGAGNALVAIAISVAILMWPVSLLPTIQRLPEINDVTTDTANPPAFQALAENRPAGAQDPAYNDAFAEVQKKAYPDLRTLSVDRPAGEVVTLAAQTLRRERMEVVREEPASAENGNVGFIEAVDRTLIMGFHDDVVVRVAKSGRGALVDVRSASRYGRHDLGRNAERIREVLAGLIERLQSTVPDQRRGRGS
jgi:hypothetical protein